MPTIKHFTTSSTGFYSGKVKNNWDAVFNNAVGIARLNIFKQLLEEPDATDVHVDEHHKQFFKEHGIQYRWNGIEAHTVTGQHEHTDKNALGQFKNWQGNRDYKFDFEVELTPKD